MGCRFGIPGDASEAGEGLGFRVSGLGRAYGCKAACAVAVAVQAAQGTWETIVPSPLIRNNLSESFEVKG